MATPFPNSKIELHQWANSILLGIVAFFVVQTYQTISTDHERLANHETRITVIEAVERNRSSQTSMNVPIEAILPSETKVKNEEQQ